MTGLPAPGTVTVSVRHNFETAHRLPQLGNKCFNLHGHSWWTEITVAAPGPVPSSGVVVEFGRLKAEVRAWIDRHLDHGTMLGVDDPLTEVLVDAGCKVYRFGVDDGRADDDLVDVESYAADLHWPSVEAVACLLGRVAAFILDDMKREGHAPPGAWVVSASVTETHVNAAGTTWVPPVGQGQEAA